MFPAFLLSPMLWKAVGVAALVAGAGWAVHAWNEHEREIGRGEVRAEQMIKDLARAEQNRILLMANAKASDALQANADKERQALNAKNRSIGLELAESLKRLRNRPERPAASTGGVPADTNVGPAGAGNAGCTGTGLFKPDGEFLAGLAADASRLRAALQACRTQYEHAQDAMTLQKQ